MRTELLKGKKILIVDDEPDVLETLDQLLTMCDVKKASTFEEAEELLEKEEFDIAVLDIMGVDGYKLLELSRKKGMIAVMLTAHALSPANIVKSFKGGAASYLPKDEMVHIPEFLEEVLEAKEKGKHFWWRWLDRWGSYYDKKFGAEWQKDDKEFWERFPYRL
ncbi:MAG: response regulator [Deltaproteobacteria bacterium]|nr:response regulator [Deltaproteobacteria bacterium]